MLPSILNLRRRLSSEVHRKRTSLAFKYMPMVAEFAAKAATYGAAKAFEHKGSASILLDSNIHSHAITHEDAWIDTETQLWGGKIPVATGYSARVSVYSASSKTPEYLDICYLTGIAFLARKGLIKLRTSSELLAEQDRHPPARFRSVTYSGMSLLDAIEVESVDGWNFDALLHGKANLAQMQHDRLAQSGDQLFQKILKILGHEKHSQDAWHIATAEKHGCAAFLTMDYKLLRLLENRKRQISSLGLSTKVLTPRDFGSLMKMRPLPPHLFSYDRASFPVRSDLHLPGERRRTRLGNRSENN